MKLSKQTDYAFRSLIFLAGQPPGQRVTVQDICEFYDISANHISKVIMRLVRRGDVDSLRGKGGGLSLARAPEDISLVDIVKEFETTLQPIDCNEQPCRIISSCSLQGLLKQAVAAFLASLAPYTLADIVSSEVQILRLED